MYIVENIRLETGIDGTFGIIRINKQIFCICLEPSWKMNQQNISCIPTGQYICKRVVSPKFGETFEILNVFNRSHVLFHPGNFVKDTQGCQILGATVEKLKGNRAALNSGVTFKCFMDIMTGIDNFHYTITENY